MRQEFHLISIAHSHYVEKARWALEHYGLAHSETRLLPLLHWAVTPWHVGRSGAPDSHSTRFSTPILRTDRGDAISGSSAIMSYLDTRFASPERAALLPSHESVELDAHYNRRLGPHTRRVFYCHLLPDRAEACRLAERNVSAAQARVFRWCYPVFRALIARGLGTTRERSDESLDHVRAEFASAGRRLADGRPYLTGDRLTAADIAFVCLGGALMLPQPCEGWGARLPDETSRCAELLRIARELRATDAGRWALGLLDQRQPELGSE